MSLVGGGPWAGRQPRRVRASLLQKGLGFRVLGCDTLPPCFLSEFLEALHPKLQTPNPYFAVMGWPD